MRDHGGNILAHSRKLGLSPERILDFSASITPLGLSRRARTEITRRMLVVPHYPEPYAESLTRVIAGHYGLSPASVLCGNGSTELIYLLAALLKPKKVLVTAPAFSEYRRACELNGAQTVHVLLRAEQEFALDADAFIRAMKSNACDMAFLCNPNNPTGSLATKADILSIANAARKLRSYLVVDEAFIEFCDGESVMASVARNPFLIVLRSMTKFHALAGLRLGFGVFGRELAARLRHRKEPWSVNSLAAAAGSVVLSDSAYRKASRSLMRREKRYVENRFKEMKIRYVPSDANYYLFSVRNPGATTRHLERKGILVRDCSNFTGLGKGYLRIAVRSRKENMVLMRELKQICRAW